MSSADPIPTTLSDQLQQLGLVHTASELNDFIARATQKRWSPVVQLERLVQAELEARLRHRVERRLRDARLGRFKPMADWEPETSVQHVEGRGRTGTCARQILSGHVL
jgi:hypothetical protein